MRTERQGTVRFRQIAITSMICLQDRSYQSLVNVDLGASCITHKSLGELCGLPVGAESDLCDQILEPIIPLTNPADSADY